MMKSTCHVTSHDTLFLLFSVSLTVHFGNGSKVSAKVSPLDTTSDLLESIKDQLTSSSAHLWLVDQSGIGESASSGHTP